MTKRRSLRGLLLVCLILYLLVGTVDCRVRQVRDEVRRGFDRVERAIRATTLPASPGLFGDE